MEYRAGENYFRLKELHMENYVYICTIKQRYKCKVMKDRLFRLIAQLGMNMRDFAKSIELSGPVLSSIKSGRTQPTLLVVSKIKAKYPNVNTNWLIAGEGEMFTDMESKKVVSETVPHQPELFPIIDDEQNIPRTDDRPDTIYNVSRPNKTEAEATPKADELKLNEEAKSITKSEVTESVLPVSKQSVEQRMLNSEPEQPAIAVQQQKSVAEQHRQEPVYKEEKQEVNIRQPQPAPPAGKREIKQIVLLYNDGSYETLSK